MKLLLIFYLLCILSFPRCKSLRLIGSKWVNYRKLSQCLVAGSLIISQTPIIQAAPIIISNPFYHSSAVANDNIKQGKTQISSESNVVYKEAKRAELAGDTERAKTLYFEVIEAEPDYIYSYSSLGNIFAIEGNINEALVYLNKAIKLLPPVDVLIPLLITKGTLESNLQSFTTALQDLEFAEKLFDSQYNQLKIRMSSKWESANFKNIQINKAVIYSRTNQWFQAFDLFDQILYNSAERNVAPWAIRYVLSGLEVFAGKDPSRPVPKVSDDFLQRLLIRFPKEPECNALATSVSMLQGDEKSAQNYWRVLSGEEQEKYRSGEFLENTVNWGPTARKGLQLYFSKEF